MARPPEQMRPDRDEVITPVAGGPVVTLQEGVVLDTLVGSFNGCRELTTGIVTFQPRAVLDRHRHPCSEAITLLEGSVHVEAEGRVYRLRAFDNIVIPRGVVHATRNVSATAEARLHVALAMGDPDRELVSQSFEPTVMPDDATGVPGFERVTRFETAARSTGIGPNSEFIDFFNSSLVPGIEMSGGYGLFHPGGRLPAHYHEFDESICIVEGGATCVVEGRCYAMRDCETAMVPRGRVHYFRNDSDATMEMIWVYAGPQPERIITDEACATLEGSPWK